MPIGVPSLIDPLKPETDEFVQNPYPVLAQLRGQAPIWWSEVGNRWLVTGYPQAQLIWRNRRIIKGMRLWQHMEKNGIDAPGLKVLVKARSKWMVHLDPPDHTQIRAVVNKAFTPNMVASLSTQVQVTADRLWDAVSGARQTELVSQLAFPYVLKTLLQLLGIPEDDHPEFGIWAKTVAERTNKGLDLQTDHPHVQSFQNYLRKFVQECQLKPQPGVVSMLAYPHDEADQFTTEEVISNCVLMLVAGYETTVNAIGNAVSTLINHPEQFALLKSSPELMKSAIAEGLRFESPVQIVTEMAATDIEIDGAAMKQTQNIMIILGACNRDPNQFENPDIFDITRRENKHLAFGEGIHHCLGSGLAELLIGTFLKTLIERAPNLRLAQPSIEFKKPFGLRGPKSLYLQW